MGVIQNSINQSMSGTAFLLNQSGFTQLQREKYEFKQKQRESEINHQARMEGIKSLHETWPDETINKDEAKMLAVVKELKRYSDENSEQLRNSPYAANRKIIAMRDGIMSGIDAFKKARQHLAEKAQSQQRVETATSTLIDALKNPNASKDDVMNAFKEKSNAEKMVIK